MKSTRNAGHVPFPVEPFTGWTLKGVIEKLVGLELISVCDQERHGGFMDNVQHAKDIQKSMGTNDILSRTRGFSLAYFKAKASGWPENLRGSS
jgi:hypothetical protein